MQQCQRCKKAVATVHLTDVNKNGNRERHLCERCAHEEGFALKPPHVQINEILASFVLNQPQIQELAQLTCPHCQMSFVEFRNGGLLGCPRDYDIFEQALAPLIQRAQNGAARHIGKSPRRIGVARDFQAELVRLRRNLEQAVEREDYEAAARLRDQIDAIDAK